MSGIQQHILANVRAPPASTSTPIAAPTQTPAPSNPTPQPTKPLPNPFSQGGLKCASDLDYETGFQNVWLPDTAAEDISRFRIDVTSYQRDDVSAQVNPSPKRTIHKESALRAALKNGGIASAIPGTAPAPSSTNTTHGQARASTNAVNLRNARSTIITIPQYYSGGPLGITRLGLQELITQLDLPTMFLPVLYAFGSVPRISEAGLDCCTNIEDPLDKGSFTLTYLYRFKEQDRNQSQLSDGWKDRQIGMLHRHCAQTNEDLYIILQPHTDSLFDGVFEDDVLTNLDAMKTLMDNPFSLHQLLIQTYFSNWRVYLKDVAVDYDKASAEAFSQDIAKDYSLNFDFLQRWRSTADDIVPISATIDSIRRIATTLKSARQTCINSQTLLPSSDFDIFIHLLLSQAEGIHQSAHALEKRIANIAELMTNTIDTKNQSDATTLNRHMERLTLDTVDDSTSVTIITYLSLIYLPGSFVASLFGMNLFDYNESSRQMDVANNFWLYVAIFVPLTAITAFVAWYFTGKSQRKRDERDRLMMTAAHR